jgi:hypothetical protein
VVVGKRSTTTRWETHGKSVPLSLLAAPLSVVCGWGKWGGIRGWHENRSIMMGVECGMRRAKQLARQAEATGMPKALSGAPTIPYMLVLYAYFLYSNMVWFGGEATSLFCFYHPYSSSSSKQGMLLPSVALAKAPSTAWTTTRKTFTLTPAQPLLP